MARSSLNVMRVLGAPEHGDIEAIAPEFVMHAVKVPPPPVAVVGGFPNVPVPAPAPDCDRVPRMIANPTPRDFAFCDQVAGSESMSWYVPTVRSMLTSAIQFTLGTLFCPGVPRAGNGP